MKIIKNIPNTSGAYSPIQDGSFVQCPSGYYIVPETLDTTIFTDYAGFVNLIIENNVVLKFIPNVEAWEAWKLTQVRDLCELTRNAKLDDISKTCNDTIIAGIDVETSQGIEHFSLEETDQINLNAALQAVQQGATYYPYHADKQLCRMFTAEEILAIVEAGTNHKVYHTTLCNHLFTWIRRAETIEELNSIIYSADNLPEDLALNMQAILNPMPAIDENVVEEDTTIVEEETVEDTTVIEETDAIIEPAEEFTEIET